jgi:hypothetical protein
MLDSFSVEKLEAGRVYDLKDTTAAILIATGCAEPCRDAGPMEKPWIRRLDEDARRR